MESVDYGFGLGDCPVPFAVCFLDTTVDGDTPNSVALENAHCSIGGGFHGINS
jgi:hypothetical protein